MTLLDPGWHPEQLPSWQATPKGAPAPQGD
jgi:hypothetical protein